MPTTLKNPKVEVIYTPDEKEISGHDLVDENNWPAFYNTSRRGIKKAWAALEKGWTNELTMSGAINILTESGLKCRRYCMMD